MTPPETIHNTYGAPRGYQYRHIAKYRHFFRPISPYRHNIAIKMENIAILKALDGGLLGCIPSFSSRFYLFLRVFLRLFNEFLTNNTNKHALDQQPTSHIQDMKIIGSDHVSFVKNVVILTTKTFIFLFANFVAAPRLRFSKNILIQGSQWFVSLNFPDFSRLKRLKTILFF